MAALEIIVDVRDGQTMSQYNTPKNGKIKFTNAVPKDTADSMLEIRTKKDAPWPFCKGDGSAKENPIEVPPGETRAAFICESFAGSEVLYTAQIGQATAEDPIIIFEKPKLQLNVVTAGVAGVLLGAVVTALVMRWRGHGVARKADVAGRSP